MEENEQIKPEHLSYQEYRKKLTKNSSDGIAIFVSAFFILLLLFLGIAKQLSPDVDVSIGDNDASNSDTLGIQKNEVDERLKLLQMEDNNKDEMFNSELEEKVVIPEHETKKAGEDEINLKEKEEPANPKPEQTASSEPKIPLQTLEQANMSVKVVVGYYATKEQANVAKEIIEESGMDIRPFVRNIGSGYTIQVGSFTSRDKAQGLVDNLLRNNYPAKMINE